MGERGRDDGEAGVQCEAVGVIGERRVDEKRVGSDGVGHRRARLSGGDGGGAVGRRKGQCGLGDARVAGGRDRLDERGQDAVGRAGQDPGGCGGGKRVRAKPQLGDGVVAAMIGGHGRATLSRGHSVWAGVSSSGGAGASVVVVGAGSDGGGCSCVVATGCGAGSSSPVSVGAGDSVVGVRSESASSWPSSR